MLYNDKKPTMIAVVTDAGLLPENARYTAIRYDYNLNGREIERARHEKGGWIALNWETKPGGMALENDSGDSSGMKEVTILVTVERALEAMRALTQGRLVC